eukprot:gene4384-14509_t
MDKGGNHLLQGSGEVNWRRGRFGSNKADVGMVVSARSAAACAWKACKCAGSKYELLAGVWYGMRPRVLASACRLPDSAGDSTESTDLQPSMARGSGKRKVVIIGAQFAGKRVKEMLPRAQFDVTLIDAKDYFEFTPGVLRCLVEPEHFSAITVTHSPDVMLGRAVAIKPADGGPQDNNEVLLADGSTVQYDYLVIATGSSYISPIKAQSQTSQSSVSTLKERRSEIACAAQELKEASSVVVVGGGAVGVELAAEVAAAYKGQKLVKLITSRPRLLDHMPKSASDFAESWFSQHGVEEAGAGGNKKAQSVSTSSGRTLSAELVYNCTGYSSFSTQLYESLLLSQPLDTANDKEDRLAIATRQGIPVCDTLQVEGYPNIFVCGDAMKTQYDKTAYTADQSAMIVAKNIAVSTKGGILQTYPQSIVGRGRSLLVAQCISLHRNSGIFQFNNLVVNGYVASLSKASIEWISMRVASGQYIPTQLWLLTESLMTQLGGFMFCTSS